VVSRPDSQNRAAHIEPAIQAKLGRRLRAVSRGFTREPVPLDHIELLLALRRAERERRSVDSAGRH
jgi:hypothetical protein